MPVFAWTSPELGPPRLIGQIPCERQGVARAWTVVTVGLN